MNAGSLSAKSPFDTRYLMYNSFLSSEISADEEADGAILSNLPRKNVLQ